LYDSQLNKQQKGFNVTDVVANTDAQAYSEFNITTEFVKKLLEIVDAGLCEGMGEQVPGQMCVEAAVCYAMGLPHGDQPTCVSDAVRTIKIDLNDASWSSDQARARGLRRIAVAQLGSKDVVDDVTFIRELSTRCIRRFVPGMLRCIHFEPTNHDPVAAAEFDKELPKLAYMAEQCALIGDVAYVGKIREHITNMSSLVFNACVYDLLLSIKLISSMRFNATTKSLDEITGDIERIASCYNNEAWSDTSDKTLNVVADIVFETLEKLGSPGCKWVHLCD